MAISGRTPPGSEPFEATVQLPVGDGGLEGALLEARRVQVVVDDLVAERLARERRRLEAADGLVQARRHARQVGVVRVAFERRTQLELAVDPVQARGDGG